MKEINAYKCDHCSKLYQIKRFAEAHEKSCTNNPDNFRACHNCSNICKRTTTIYEDDPRGGEMERNVSLLYCKAKEVFIYPPSVEHKGNAFDLDTLNEPMPKECDKQKKHEYLTDTGSFMVFS